jgi:hypothetical protein
MIDVASVRTGTKTRTDRNRPRRKRARVPWSGISSVGARIFMVPPRHRRAARQMSGKRQKRRLLLASNTGWPKTEVGVTSIVGALEGTAPRSVVAKGDTSRWNSSVNRRSRTISLDGLAVQ